MKKYILTSPKFAGQVTFGYDHNGDLIFYNNEIPDETVVKWMKRFLPVDAQYLEEFKTKVQATIQEVPEDLTFNRFWQMQIEGKKINKKRCEPLWDKMNENQCLLAIVRYNDYVGFCTKNRRYIADPETYLRKEYYETDWRAQK